MIHLEHPSNEIWEERRNWFEQKAEPSDDGGYLLSEHACAMVADLQCAFCAGAWIAVIVLAAAAIDAHLHDAEGFTGSSKRVIDEAGADPLLHDLRKRRNALIHSDSASPAITVDQQWSERTRLEGDARLAVELVFRVFYANPSI
ncbi:hypothetical protein ACFQBQ_17175 [Granulicella cerasi]|uniref:HEPN domain-containing protein n=1 Tax=Granulicella cerasi TaxID=741063 RepID=A0ABW1ZDN8_9BACT|nr:hypothetical protein [Granulicella cerasi]